MAERKFVPKEGQVDYTNIRYAPVVNTVVVYKEKILLVRRSQEMRLYPGYWNGISGFLDDGNSIEDKVREELSQELNIPESHVLELTRGRPLLQEAPEYDKTWLVVPVRAEVISDEFQLNWEATEAQWFTLNELKGLNLLPGFEAVLHEFYPKVLK